MDLFRMRCFVLVAEQLNLTRAAQLAGITQPAMSLQMRELERETGLSLLSREKHRIALTDAGRTVYEGFVDILSLYETTMGRARAGSLTGGKTGLVRTGYHGSLTAFSTLYQGFAAAEPKIEVTVRVAEWLQLTNMAVSGELDVVFTERHETDLRPELQTAPLFTEDFFCVAVSTGHPLARQASVTVGQLQDEHLLMSGYKSTSIDAMYHQLVSNGFRRERIRIVEDVDSAIAMAAAGLGLATMPRFLAIPQNPSVTWVPVTGLTFACEIVAAWRRDSTNPHVKAFVDYCAQPRVIEELRASWALQP